MEGRQDAWQGHAEVEYRSLSYHLTSDWLYSSQGSRMIGLQAIGMMACLPRARRTGWVCSPGWVSGSASCLTAKGLMDVSVVTWWQMARHMRAFGGWARRMVWASTDPPWWRRGRGGTPLTCPFALPRTVRPQAPLLYVIDSIDLWVRLMNVIPADSQWAMRR